MIAAPENRGNPGDTRRTGRGIRGDRSGTDHEGTGRRALAGRGAHLPAVWLVALTLLLAASATAEESAAERPAPGSRGPTATGSGSTDVELGEVEIRGELEKPKIFFILPKAQRDAETRQRRIRFYPDILEPLDKDRFEEEARVLYQHGIPAE